MKKFIVIAGAIMFHSCMLFAQESTFILTADRLHPYFPTYLANGYFGIASSPLGTKPAESYAAWLFDEGPGDVSRIAQLPAWNAINYSDGTQWLNALKPDSVSIHSYGQTLDMKDGVLRTEFEWSDGAKNTHVENEVFVSRADKNLAAVKLAVTPDYSGRVSVAFSIQSNAKPHRMRLGEEKNIQVKMVDGWPDVWYPGYMELKMTKVDRRSILARAKAEGRDASVVEAVEFDWSKNVMPASIDTMHEADGSPAVRMTFDVSSGVRYVFYKFVAVATSRDTKDPVGTVKKMAHTAHTRSYDKLINASVQAWHKIWKTDIIAEGNPEFQRLIHSMMFYLLCSVRDKTGFGIPPMGLSSCGYYGHLFWDSDTWMFPPLLVMHPEYARSMVDFRFHTLEAAKQNAIRNNYAGAMYPWEADDLGKEAIPVFAIQNGLYENHVTGDVALAQWQYYLLTGNKAWLARFGFPVIRQTADFWVSRSLYNKDLDRYEIRNIVSVNEGLVGIANDAYTNAVAQKNLTIAVQAAKILGTAPDPQWELVGRKMLIPFDSTRQLHPTYDNAPDSLLGSVVPLLAYPLELPMSTAAKKNDITNGAKESEAGPGVMMGVTLLPVVAAEVGDKQMFDRLVLLSYEAFLRPPFQVLAETPKNNSINFLTGAGGFLQQVIFGYTGLRIREKGLTPVYQPMLPETVTRLVLKNFYSRGKRFTIIVENGAVRFQSGER